MLRSREDNITFIRVIKDLVIAVGAYRIKFDIDYINILHRHQRRHEDRIDSSMMMLRALLERLLL